MPAKEPGTIMFLLYSFVYKIVMRIELLTYTPDWHENLNDYD